MIMRLLIPIAAMAALGLIFGVGLAYALKLFGIKIDPLVENLRSKLPGGNCGACGRAGCMAFAEALKAGEVLPENCPVSNDERRKILSEILGIDYHVKVKTAAKVICNGGKNAKDKYIYRGIKTCRAASLVFSGHKLCAWGCLGFGDCVEVCPFRAIKMSGQGIPVINPDKCTACGKCVKTCPKNIIELIPVKNNYYVKCSSKDTGAVTRKACSSGCIACLKCEKACPLAAIKVQSYLSKIDYEKCQNSGKCFEVCPTKVIVKGN